MATTRMSELKNELGDYLREQRQGAKLSLRQLAEAAGVSNPYLSQVERGLRKPSAEVLQQIAKGLRVSAEALYVRAGLLEDRGDRVEVEAAVLADPQLTERQRQVLLDIYESFRAENARQSRPPMSDDEIDDVLAEASPAPKQKPAKKAARSAATKTTQPKKSAASTKSTRSATTQSAKKAPAKRASVSAPAQRPELANTQKGS